MEHHAGIDVSLERSSVCVVDATGRIVREAKVASEPEALVDFFRRLGLPLARVGLEAGPLSQWLHAGLAGARGGPRWRSPASWRPFSIVSGPTAASSASARRRQRRDRLTGEKGEFGAG